MRLRHVSVHNMRSIGHIEFDVQPGLTLVLGDNGVGKSTAVGHAVRWGLWGYTAERTQDDLVRSGERELEVGIDFDGPGGRYRVVRQFRLAASGKGGTSWLSFGHVDPNVPIDLTGATIAETQAAIENVVGPYEAFANTAYVDQRDGAGAFLEATPADRRRVLRELLALTEGWDAWHAAEQERLRSLSEELPRIEGRHASEQERAESLPKLEEAVANELPAVEEAEAEVRRARESLERRGTALREARVASEARKQAENNLSAAETRATEARVSLDTTTRLRDALRPILDRSDDVRRRQQESEELMAGYRTAFAETKGAGEEWDLEMALHQEVRSHVAGLILRAGVLGDQISVSQGDFNTLNQPAVGDHTCPICQQSLVSEEARAQVQKQRETVRDKLLRLQGERDYILEETAHGVVLTAVDDAIEVMGERPLSPSAPEIDPSVAKETADLQHALENMEAREDDVVRADTELKAAVEALQSIRARALPEAGVGIDHLTSDVNDARDRARKAEESLRNAHATFARLEAERGAAAASQTAAADLNVQLEWLRKDVRIAELASEAFGPQGVRQLMIDQALNSIEAASNRWLQILMPECSIAFSTQRESGLESLEEAVLTPTGLHPWRGLSGAQGVAVALAVRFALGEAAGASHGVHYETVIVDEADAWLIGPRQDAYLRVLAAAADKGVDILCISHIEGVQDAVNQQIRLVQKEGVTTLCQDD